ncbi:hypothetical protein ACFWCO_30675, partial [Streptomyces diastaticus]|uniref:hypothetical protein n=1 Tax=Streptomyces diastaticus TaxID=1956 RepID=UPI0036C674C3
GAAEDRNAYTATVRRDQVHVAVALRGDRGSQPPFWTPRPGRCLWRSPSGATEDRNTALVEQVYPGYLVAVALRGDRGSQLS